MLLDWPKLESSFKNELGTSFVIHEAVPLPGGDINLAFRLETNQGRYFVKLNTPDKVDMFEAERAGLLELGKCDALAVPEPISVGQNANAAFLCMSFLDLHADINQAQLGEAIAALHEPLGQQFGAESNNFIGSTVQHNGWVDDWAGFFWEKRLAPQIHKLLDSEANFPEQALDPLKDKVDAILTDVTCVPSMVHGDLWHGNVGTTSDGRPSIFDPAVYWGHAETDLAMARLFGGFSQEFFDAYEAIRPAQTGEEERLLIYQLYHLLNHYNLFGSSYLDRCTTHIGKIMRL